MLQDIVAVKPLDNYKLHLRFEDGVEGIVNLKELIEFSGVFEPLHDDSYFRQVTVSDELGTIQWPNEADLDPDVLYAAITDISISSSPPTDSYGSSSSSSVDIKDQVDVIQIRTFHPELLNGSLLLRDGIRILASAKRLVEAAASSTIEPRSYYGSKKFKQVNEYLENIRIGQTEQGSYIFNIISPLNSLENEQDSHYSREVVKTLFRALSSLKDISDKQKEESRTQEEDLTQIIEQGVSGNLCKAIAEMGGHESDFGFGFKLIGSPSIRNLNSISTEIVFPSKAIPKISHIGKKLKQSKIKPNSKKTTEIYILRKSSYPVLVSSNLTRIEGLVVKLEWAGGDQKAKITVVATIDNEEKSVLLEIGMQDYMIAFKANLDQATVTCSGILSVGEGDVCFLEEVRDFHILL